MILNRVKWTSAVVTSMLLAAGSGAAFACDKSDKAAKAAVVAEAKSCCDPGAKGDLNAGCAKNEPGCAQAAAPAIAVSAQPASAVVPAVAVAGASPCGAHAVAEPAVAKATSGAPCAFAAAGAKADAKAPCGHKGAEPKAIPAIAQNEPAPPAR